MTTIAIIAFDGATDIDVFLHREFLNRPATMFPRQGLAWRVRLLDTESEHVATAGQPA